MENTIKANIQKSPYTMLGNGMIVYGILWIISTVLNFAARWLIYKNLYTGGSSSSYNWYASYILYIIFSLVLIAIAEVIAIVIFIITANSSHITVFKQLSIIHVVFIIYLIGDYFLPLILAMLDVYNSNSSMTLFLIYSIAGFGSLVILLLSDWFLYQLCTKVLYQYPIKRGFILYLPFVLMAFHLISYLIGNFSSNFVFPLIFDSFAIVIPIVWILLGSNLKLIAPISENTAGYTVGEPRLDYSYPQGDQEGIELNLQNTPSTSNTYGNCFQCGKPRKSLVEVFCSNCGNRF